MKQSDSELLTRVGPGTPMGTLMRQYWVPAAASAELPSPGCAPLRVMLLGEKLVAFRTKNGEIGLMEHLCPHRCANLFFGRVEEDGLRCVYHGWKFAPDGQCIEMPSETPETDFKDRIRAKTYPCVERGGIVWTYMGPRDVPPPLPDIEANQMGEDEWNMPLDKADGKFGLRTFMTECNWLQAIEGGIDTAHQVFLHLGHIDVTDTDPDTFRRYSLENRAAKFDAADMDYGTLCAARRPAGEGKEYWRMTQYLFPFYTMDPIDVLGQYIGCRAWVPMDDHHTMHFSMHDQMPFRPYLLPGQPPKGGHLDYLPQTSDWFGRAKFALNESNDYGVVRDQSNYSGIELGVIQDQMVTEQMGKIVERGDEHLGSSDRGILTMRRRLLRLLRDIEKDPSMVLPGVDDPEVYRQRSGGVVLDEGVDWLKETEDLREGFRKHEGLSRAVRGGFI